MIKHDDKFNDYQATELIEAFGQKKPITVLASSQENASTYIRLIQEHAKLLEQRMIKIQNYRP